MKKWIKGVRVIGVLLIVAMLATPVFATQRKTVLADDVTLDYDTNDTGWLQRATGNSEKVTFFVTMDKGTTTAGVTAEVTVQVSADGVNWKDITWYDVVGGTTKQASETIDTADETYVMWLDTDVLYPHVRIKVSADGSTHWYENGDDEVGITVTIVEQK